MYKNTKQIDIVWRKLSIEIPSHRRMYYAMDSTCINLIKGTVSGCNKIKKKNELWAHSTVLHCSSICTWPFFESIRWYFWLIRLFETTSVRVIWTYPRDSWFHKIRMISSDNINKTRMRKEFFIASERKTTSSFV